MKPNPIKNKKNNRIFGTPIVVVVLVFLIIHNNTLTLMGSIFLFLFLNLIFTVTTIVNMKIILADSAPEIQIEITKNKYCFFWHFYTFYKPYNTHINISCWFLAFNQHSRLFFVRTKNYIEHSIRIVSLRHKCKQFFILLVKLTLTCTNSCCTWSMGTTYTAYATLKCLSANISLKPLQIILQPIIITASAHAFTVLPMCHSTATEEK